MTKPESKRPPDRGRRAFAFLLPLAALTYYALRGGSYDIVVRQEESIAVWWIIGVGAAVGVLPRVRPTRMVLIPLAFAALLTLWTLLSLGWTSSEERTLAEVARVSHYIGIAVLVWCLAGRSTWRPAAAGVLTAGALVSALALASRLAPSAFPADDVGRVFDQNRNRLNYPFNYWNALSAWCAMTMAMALVWSAHARSSLVRAICLAVIPVCAAAAYLTYSRQGIFGVALAAVVVVALSHNRFTAAANALVAAGASYLVLTQVASQSEIADATGNNGAGAVVVALGLAALICAAGAFATQMGRVDTLRLPRRLAIAAVGVGAALLLAVAIGPASARIDRALNEFKNQAPVAAQVNDPGGASDPGARLTQLNFGGGRYEQWKRAVETFEEHPGKGTGAGTFEFSSDRGGLPGQVRDAHSLYLEPLAELGVPGLVLTLGFLLSLLALALAARRKLEDPAHIGAQAAGTAAFVVFLLHAGVDWMWEMTSVSVLALTAIALSITAGGALQVTAQRLARVGLVGAALLGCLVALPGLASTSALRESRSAFVRGDVGGALSAAEDSIRSEPWAATPYVQRALVARSLQDLGAAARDLDRAIAREPENWRHPLLASRVAAERGRVRTALAYYARAKRLRPASAFVGREPLSPVAP